MNRPVRKSNAEVVSRSQALQAPLKAEMLWEKTAASGVDVTKELI